jgi:hypothetical protein
VVLKEKSVNKEKNSQDDTEWKGLHGKMYCPTEHTSNRFRNYINVDYYVKKLLFLVLKSEVKECENKLPVPSCMTLKEALMAL